MADQPIMPLEGTVSAVAKKDGDPTGIQLEEHPDQWWNFSKIMYRDKPYDIPEKGDRIAMGVQGGKWIKWIQKAATREQAMMSGLIGDFAPSARDNSIQRQVALKCAIEFTKSASLGEVMMAADAFADWLAGGTGDAAGTNQLPDDGDPGPTYE